MLSNHHTPVTYAAPAAALPPPPPPPVGGDGAMGVKRDTATGPLRLGDRNGVTVSVVVRCSAAFLRTVTSVLLLSSNVDPTSAGAGFKGRPVRGRKVVDDGVYSRSETTAVLTVVILVSLAGRLNACAVSNKDVAATAAATADSELLLRRGLLSIDRRRNAG